MTVVALLKALAAGAAGLAVLYGYLYLSQDAMVFPGASMSLEGLPGVSGRYPDVESMRLSSPDGTVLEGWLVDRGRGAPLLIYFGGNAEEVSYNIPELRKLLPGWSIALFNYRGCG